MPQNSWSASRERQYGHIKESLIERGKPEWLAEEIADLVDINERVQPVESWAESPSTINDLSPSRNGELSSY